MARQVTEEERKQAQKYAQEALEGKRGYLSVTQVPNAMMNAQVPIKTNTTEAKVDAGTVAAADRSMNKYLAELERQRSERERMLKRQYTSGKKSINRAAEGGNKEAYIAYMQGMKNMPQKAAVYGAGGMAQSLANKSQLNYENNRNNIEQSRLAALADLEADYRAGVMEGRDQYLTQLQTASEKAAAALKGTGGTVKGYSIGDNKSVHTGSDEQVLEGLINELLVMGFTRAQAEEYIRRQM